jgi:hypothetical protein
LLIEEAKWFGENIRSFEPDDIFPMCNVGSSTWEFRTMEQPWIDEFIFAPARDLGQTVKHVDIKDAPGVDIVGDLLNPGFRRQLSQLKFKSVFCSNLLEHVGNRREISAVLTAIVPVGGHLFVSCPYRYPRHLDPVDTGFRPDIQGLAATFQGTSVVSGEIVINGTYWDVISDTPFTLLKTGVRLLLPFYKFRNWQTNVYHLPWLMKRFEATCVVLRREA